MGNGPRRGYWRARVVPGGETGVFVGFSLHVCEDCLWELTLGCSPYSHRLDEDLSVMSVGDVTLGKEGSALV